MTAKEISEYRFMYFTWSLLIDKGSLPKIIAESTFNASTDESLLNYGKIFNL